MARLVATLILTLLALVPLWAVVPLPTKIGHGTAINAGNSLASGLVRVIVLTEGASTATDRIGAGTGTLVNSAAWVTEANLGGTAVDFTAGSNAGIDFGNGGLSHGNGHVSVFYGGRVQVDAAYHDAGVIAGSGVDSYSFGVDASDKWKFTLRTVVDITMTGDSPVDGRIYTVGSGYTEATSARFHVYDQTSSAQITPETVVQGLTPAQVNASSYVGNSDPLTASWAEDLAFLYIWNRVLSDAEFVTLHANPYVFFGAPRMLLLGVGP